MFSKPAKSKSSIRAVAVASLMAWTGFGLATPAQAGLLTLAAAPARPLAALALDAVAQAGKLRALMPDLAAAGGMAFADMTIRTASTTRANAPPLPAKAGKTGDVFGSVAIAFRRLPAIDRLAPALDEMDRTSLMRCEGEACTEPRGALMQDLRAMRGVSLLDKAMAVNARVNAHVRYQRDADNYGVIDHWATPLEILKRRAGDCEDYAILKMALLRELGVAGEDMAVVVLRDESRGLYHAVLSLRAENGEHLILDNMRDAVLADGALPHYLPLYSISAGKGFIHGRRAGSSPVQMSSMPLDKVAPGEGPVAADGALQRY